MPPTFEAKMLAANLLPLPLPPRCPVSQGILKQETHGQVFTPPHLVAEMLSLRRNTGRTLESSCGSGAFSNEIDEDLLALDIDPDHAPGYARVMDFFDLPVAERFSTVIGNPPYLCHQAIPDSTKAKLGLSEASSPMFDKRANLYLFFIEKCVRHLDVGGELIFVVPRDFPRATAARKLNAWLFENGTITDFRETGDARIFRDACPPCCIFRYEKGRLDRTMHDGRTFAEHNGQLFFLEGGKAATPLDAFFDISVGGLTGADGLYIRPDGNIEIVYSQTAVTGQPRRMLDGAQAKELLVGEKQRLLARKVRNFTEANWWEWGRNWKVTDAPRIYVNSLTRNQSPFFINECKAYDGSIIALFPKQAGLSLEQLARVSDVLNDVDWASLGFKAGGRYIFSQRALKDCLLPADAANRLQQIFQNP